MVLSTSFCIVLSNLITNPLRNQPFITLLCLKWWLKLNQQIIGGRHFNNWPMDGFLIFLIGDWEIWWLLLHQKLNRSTRETLLSNSYLWKHTIQSFHTLIFLQILCFSFLFERSFYHSKTFLLNSYSKILFKRFSSVELLKYFDSFSEHCFFKIFSLAYLLQ